MYGAKVKINENWSILNSTHFGTTTINMSQRRCEETCKVSAAETEPFEYYAAH